MNANERFEYMAELFYKKTGCMAPGKDSPAALGGIDEKERMDLWKDFIEEFYSGLFELHKSNEIYQLKA